MISLRKTNITNFCVSIKVMEGAMGSATTTTTPADQVDDLIRAVADEAGLEVSEQLASVPTGNIYECCAQSVSLTHILFNTLFLGNHTKIFFIKLNFFTATIGESTSQAATVSDDPLGRRLAALRE